MVETPWPAAPELTDVIAQFPAGDALDLACGGGRHSVWLAERGWRVTAVDLQIEAKFPGEPADGREIRKIKANLEDPGFAIQADAWDLIVCWLYWQPDLLPAIARGVRPGGVVALAGKTSGRFATSLAQYRAAFPGFIELSSGENEVRAFFLARR
jgi:SAM-dependent methyltransferase